tara:strand:- start:69 stop:275 length:207 start_codon:yes stop_codon:yes gene_type:complete
MTTTHIERMEIEHKELGKKITGLNAFIHENSMFNKLCVLEQKRMLLQAKHMRNYAIVLEQRVWTALGK